MEKQHISKPNVLKSAQEFCWILFYCLEKLLLEKSVTGEIAVEEIAVEEVALGKCPDTLPVFVNCSNNVVLTRPSSDL